MQKRGTLIFDLDGTVFQVDRVSIPAVQRATGGRVHAGAGAGSAPVVI